MTSFTSLRSIRWPIYWIGATACLILASMCASSSAKADDLPIVGLDKNHHETMRPLSSEDYLKTMRQLISSVHAATLPALQSQERKNASSDPAIHPTVQWMLRDVCVGVKVSLTAGLGPIWNVTAAPRIRLGFSNSTHPKLPD